MSTAAINKNVDCFSGCEEKSVVNYLMTPLVCFWDFIKATPYLIKSISQLAETV